MKTKNNNSFSKDSLSNLEFFYDGKKYEGYVAKHRKPSPAELGLVNGLPIECCPHCGGTHFKKSGYFSNGTRRYRCLDCGKAFSPLTGTVFDAHKIPISEWIEYVMHLFEFHSLSSSARDNRHAKTYPIVPYQQKWRKMKMDLLPTKKERKSNDKTGINKSRKGIF